MQGAGLRGMPEKYGGLPQTLSPAAAGAVAYGATAASAAGFKRGLFERLRCQVRGLPWRNLV